MVGGLLHVGRIAVGESEFGEYGVHLGGVFTGLAEYVDHFSAGVFLFVGPRRDACHGFVAGLASAELAAGYDYVGGEELGVGDEHSELFLHAQCADECLLFLLKYLHHFGLCFDSAPVGGHDHPDLVAVEGVHGVAFGHEYRFAVLVGHHGVLAVGAADECACRHAAALRGLVFARRHFEQVAVKRQFGQLQCYGAVRGRGVFVDGVGHLAIVEGVVFLAADIFEHFRSDVLGGCLGRCSGRFFCRGFGFGSGSWHFGYD